MKKMIQAGLVAILVLSNVALADDQTPPAAATLASTMKDMQTNFHQIAGQASDSTQNISSEALCDNLIADIAAAQTFTPPGMSKTPPSFVALLGKLSAEVQAMKNDFVQNNNASAVKEVSVINNMKLSGHAQFNNQ
jgi:hypothetical protein